MSSKGRKGAGESKRAGNTLKVFQVNTQGGKSDILTHGRQLLEQSKETAFFAVQEAGKAFWDRLDPHPTNPDLRFGQLTSPRSGSRAKPLFAAMQRPRGRKAQHPWRNAQAMVSNVPIEDVQELTSGKLGKGLRPPMAVETEGEMVATVHAPSGKPKFAASQLAAQMTDFFGQVKRKRKAGAFVGDFNASRKYVEPVLPPRTHFVMPETATQQSGGTLDGGVFTDPAEVRQGTAMAGDHTYQEYEMLRPTKKRKG